MPRAPLLSTLLLTIGCGGAADTTIDIIFDYRAPLVVAPAEDSTAEERASIEAAIAMWNDLGLTHLTLEGDETMARIPISFREAAPAFFGLYEDELGEVFINRGFTDHQKRAITVAHELGHAFGLVHVEKEDHVCVMNPANLEEPPNASDSAALQALAVR